MNFGSGLGDGVLAEIPAYKGPKKAKSHRLRDKSLSVNNAKASVEYKMYTHRDGDNNEVEDHQELKLDAFLDLNIAGQHTPLRFAVKKNFDRDVSVKDMVTRLYKEHGSFRQMAQEFARKNKGSLMKLSTLKFRLGDNSVATAGQIWHESMRKIGHIELVDPKTPVSAKYLRDD